jgi:hypothetical protein
MVFPSESGLGNYLNNTNTIKEKIMEMKKMCRLLWILPFVVSVIHAERIKLYTFYTPSHSVLVNDWFLPSIKALNEYDLVVKCYEQECARGEYGAAGWTKTMSYKVDLLIDAIKENMGSYFVYSDVDIQFFRSTLSEINKALDGNDIVFQRDSPVGQEWPEGIICAGFIACRANQDTLDLWLAIREYMERNVKACDQTALNNVIREERFSHIKWGVLPETFFGGGTVTGKGWLPGKSLPVPKAIVLHHANWTNGINWKIAQLKYVKAIALSQKNR